MKTTRRRFSLARRFTLVFSCVVLVVTGLLAVLIESYMSRILNRQSELRARSLALSLAAVSRPYLLTYDYLAVQQMADATIQEPDLAYVVILDKEGKVAGYGGHRDRQGMSLTGLADLRAVHADQPKAQRVSHHDDSGNAIPVVESTIPVRVGDAGERWGTVRVGLSLEPVQREMLVARLFLLFAAACGVVLSVFAAHVLARRVARPLERLVKAATDLERGEWNRGFQVRTGDEIEELAGSFSQAAASLDRQKNELLAAKEELTALNATLEEKVQRRTAELAASREKYRLLVEGSPDAFVLLEQDRIAFANRSFLKIFQYPADTAVLENLRWTQVIHPDFHRAARDQIRRAEESLGEFRLDVVGQTRSGKPVEVEVRGRGVSFRNGTAVELVLSDVGEKKRLLRQVVHSERLRAMGEMTAMVAHNFNNLLAVIIGRTQLLVRKAETAEMREGLEMVKSFGVRAGEMVRQLQEYFGEEIDLRFAEVDVNACLREVTVYLESLWRTTGEAGQPPVRVRLDLEPVPHIFGAEHLLQDVFRRLLVNAAEAMPDGGEVRVHTESDGASVKIEVQDEGVGLSPEVQRRAFDPFFTTKGSRTRGLGLSTSFGIVQRHEGRIEIRPRSGRGAEVEVVIPAMSHARRVVPFPVNDAPVAGGPSVEPAARDLPALEGRDNDLDLPRRARA